MRPRTETDGIRDMILRTGAKTPAHFAVIQSQTDGRSFSLGINRASGAYQLETVIFGNGRIDAPCGWRVFIGIRF